MSNKLYTEKEVLSMLKIHLADEEQAEGFVNILTPIELPSDEEIEKFAFEKYHDVEDSRWFEPLKVGAKWMLDKIQGGNK